MAEAYTRVSAEAQGGGDGVNTDTELGMDEEEDSSFSLEVPLTAWGADDFERGAILGRLRERQLHTSCHSAVRCVCVNRSLGCLVGLVAGLFGPKCYLRCLKYLM